MFSRRGVYGEGSVCVVVGSRVGQKWRWRRAHRAMNGAGAGVGRQERVVDRLESMEDWWTAAQ
ncbi:hypothetical protein N7539_007191 [Penicillium diatomitis]|uniref:Uncharacterized protein n=1 Tax=Penicillium diatomitis TaxID=2819901 RepID=A0A9W9WV32_9EURO|nr:uncharacterized protein N7539_007191 [Penicillium diatomitis]KAJ5477047.1 hypothetical protein N7539_007191 [Penicillium diatomitis]